MWKKQLGVTVLGGIIVVLFTYGLDFFVKGKIQFVNFFSVNIIPDWITWALTMLLITTTYMLVKNIKKKKPTIQKPFEPNSTQIEILAALFISKELNKTPTIEDLGKILNLSSTEIEAEAENLITPNYISIVMGIYSLSYCGKQYIKNNILKIKNEIIPKLKNGLIERGYNMQVN
jgi:hypothetical protein